MAAVSVVRIVGAAEARHARPPEGTLTTQRVLAEAARIVLGDAALEPRDVGGLGVSPFTLRPDRAIDLAVALGLDLGRLMDTGTGGASGIDMLQHAALAVEAGDARTILLVADNVFHCGDVRALVDEYNVPTRDHLAPLPFGGPGSLFRAVAVRHNGDLHDGDGLTTGLAVLAPELWRRARAAPEEIDVVSGDGARPAHRPRVRGPARCARRARRVPRPGEHLGRTALGRAGRATGDMHGLVEVVEQLRGRAGERQGDGARRGVVTGYGMVVYRYGASADAAVREAA
jgi:hypothetical protein